jgi:hypothetical protein
MTGEQVQAMFIGILAFIGAMTIIITASMAIYDALADWYHSGR